MPAWLIVLIVIVVLACWLYAFALARMAAKGDRER